MKNNLPSVVTKGKKRVGRGYGSGKGGHTVGRGQKGQKARRTIGILFEGMKMKKSLIKRLPIKRGQMKNTGGVKPYIINLDKLLNYFKKGETVSEKTLIEKGLVTKEILKIRGLKILGSSKKETTHDLKFEGIKTSRSFSKGADENPKKVAAKRSK